MKQKNIILSITSGLTLLFFLPLSMAMNNAVYINNWGPLLGGIVLVSLLASVLLFAALSKSKPVVASFVQAVLVSLFYWFIFSRTIKCLTEKVMILNLGNGWR
ncbi:MAG: hypothetical protein ACLU99_01535 [Alphaproteobacteria bacterium]